MIRALGLLTAGVVAGFCLDDPADRVRTETVTVTEQVEVPGPTVVRWEPLPDACKTMIDMFDLQVDQLRQYSAGIAPQTINLNRSQQAIASKSVDLHNEAMTVQYEIQNNVAGPLRELMFGQDPLDQAQARCQEERKE